MNNHNENNDNNEFTNGIKTYNIEKLLPLMSVLQKERGLRKEKYAAIWDSKTVRYYFTCSRSYI